ncbi:PAS domain S-box protein [Myxococcota bacterium]
MDQARQRSEPLESDAGGLSKLFEHPKHPQTSLFDRTPMITLRVNADGRVVDANDATGAAVGREKEEMVGLLGGEVVACVNALADAGCGRGEPCKTCAVRTSIMRTVETGQGVHQREAQLTVRVGIEAQVRHFLVTTAALTENGARDEVVLWLDDVTDHKLAVEELAKHKQALEQLLEQGTAELCRANEQLQDELAERNRTSGILRARAHLFEYAADHTLDELFEETLNSLERLTGSQISFCHPVDPDQRALTLRNWSSATKNSFCTTRAEGAHYEIARAGVWAECFCRRQPVLHNDYASLPHKKGLPPGYAEVVRELVVPVLRHDKVVAILGVGNKPNHYDQSDVRVVSTFADLVWDVVERKQAKDQLERLNRVLHAVRGVNPLILREKDPDRLLQQVCDVLVSACGYRAAWLAAQDACGAPVRWAERSRDGESSLRLESLAQGRWPPCRDQLLGTTEGVALFDTQEMCRHCAFCGSPQDSALGILLRHCDRTLGVLVVVPPQHLLFEQEERALLTDLADDLALALWSIEADAIRRQSEERYRALTDGSVLGIGLSQGSQVVFANRALIALLGCDDLAELARRPLIERVTPESRSAIEAWMAAVARDEPIEREFEYDIIRKDGEIRTLQACSTHLWLNGERWTQTTFRDITSLRQAETERARAVEALKREQALLREIAGNLPNSYISIIESDLTIGFASGYEFKKQGRNPNDFVGLTLVEVFGKAAPVVVEHYLKTFSGEETTFEVLFEGEHQLYRTVPLREEDGPIRRILAVVENITERKQAEASLAQSEAKFRQLSEKAVVGICIIQDAAFAYVNPCLAEVLGYETAEIAGRLTPRDLFHPEDIDAVMARLSQGLTRAAREPDVVYRAVRRDGTEIQVEVYGQAIDYSGRPAVLGTVIDVTERQQSRAAYRTLFETANAAIVVTTVSGHVVDANDAFVDLTGYPHRELDALKTDRLYQDPTEWAGVQDAIRKRGELKNHEAQIVTKSGESKWISVSTRLTTMRGEACLLSVMTDVTERRQMQASMVQADRLASMGTLAAGIAHEINNPLTYVLYNLEMLTGDLPKLSATWRQCRASAVSQLEWDECIGALEAGCGALDGISERLQDALEGSRRIRKIARGLSTFSRVDQDCQVPVRLTEAIDVAITMAANEIKYRCKLTTEYGKSVPVAANDGRLSQVFLNLLVNATHAIREGNVEENEIRVRTWQEGDEVYTEVSDTGEGISPANLGRVFEPFFTTKAPGVGTGLGLFITKNIVEAYGGRIEVKSAVGRGTSFVVRLPARSTEAVEQPPRAVLSEPPPDTAAEPGARGRILLIEDEPAVRAATRRVLGEHEVVEAASGEEARYIVEQDQAFDVVLCDLMMPRVSGVQFHEWLVQTYPVLARLVVFVTGGAFTPQVREYLEAVGNSCLEKPVAVGTLRTIVREHIRRATRSRVLSRLPPV